MSDPVSAERQRVLDLIADWLGYYPEDIFPPLALGQENSHDQIAAHAMRHVLRGLREQVEDGAALPALVRVPRAGMTLSEPGWFYPDPPEEDA